MRARDLILAAPTLVPHRSPIGPVQVRALVDAAADAGFAGMSIWTAHADWVVAGGGADEALFEWHRERGLTMPAAEVVLDWAGLDPRAVRDVNARLVDVAARAGARTVIAVTLEPELPPLAEAARALGALCDLAADRGLAVSVEFLPWTGLPTLASAVGLIEAADRDNLGLVLDAWHWFRQPGGPDLEAVRALPPDRIHVLQLDDAPARPADDLPAETATARLLPGEGDIDLDGMLDAVDAIGAEPIVVSEVFSATLAALGPAENARRQHAAATTLLSRRDHAADRANVW
jgi:sugar phosphate isomerase/epimerase